MAYLDFLCQELMNDFYTKMRKNLKIDFSVDFSYFLYSNFMTLFPSEYLYRIWDVLILGFSNPSNKDNPTNQSYTQNNMNNCTANLELSRVTNININSR